MKRIKVGIRWIKDVAGVMALMLMTSLATICCIDPTYVGFKAWCVGEACEDIFMFIEPTDEQLLTAATWKLRRRLVEYCAAHDINVHWYDLDIKIIRHLVWGSAHRNVKLEYEWLNPVTGKREKFIKNIRIVFGYAGEFIDPYPSDLK